MSTDSSTRHRVSPKFIGSRICDRWRPQPRIHWHRASSPQGSYNNNGRCLLRFHHGPILDAPLFSHTHCWYEVDMCDTESIRRAWFAVEQDIRQGWVLAPPLFNIFFAAVINVAYTRFKADKNSRDALVHLSKRTGAGRWGGATAGEPALMTLL